MQNMRALFEVKDVVIHGSIFVTLVVARFDSVIVISANCLQSESKCYSSQQLNVQNSQLFRTIM